MPERSIRKAIIFVGNTGVGKSYICNRIFELCGSPTRFRSTGSNFSVSQTLQNGSITFNGRSFTVIDSPGFFDTSADTAKGDSGNDGKNMCKLVKAVENCEEIYALVFVYTDRFSLPHKMWFDRMSNLLTEANRGHIILLHNKQEDYDVSVYANNLSEIRQLLGGGTTQEYVWLSYKPENDQVQSLLTNIAKFTPFQLSNLVVPEVCYEKIEEGAPYEEEVARTTKDEGNYVDQTKDTSHEVEEVVEEGHYVEEIKDTSHFETRNVWNRSNPAGFFGTKLPGAKKEVQVWVPSQTVEKVWIPTKTVKKWVPSQTVERIWVSKNVTRRTMKTYVNVYKVRFDGSKDLVEKKETNTRQEVV